MSSGTHAQRRHGQAMSPHTAAYSSCPAVLQMRIALARLLLGPAGQSAASGVSTGVLFLVGFWLMLQP